MSARVENLTERLKAVVSEIETCKASGQAHDELLAEQAKIEAELRRARSLLTEGSEAKVLRG
jgi:hypothetical protein